jgi:hypothetical protein
MKHMVKKESFSMLLDIIIWHGGALRTEVQCQAKGYSFKFWDGHDKQGRHGRAREVIRQMHYFNANCWEGGIFRKEFEYPSEEDALHRYMAAFNNRLSAVIAGQ